jgi:hypothetical protein
MLFRFQPQTYYTTPNRVIHYLRLSERLNWSAHMEEQFLDAERTLIAMRLFS